MQVKDEITDLFIILLMTFLVVFLLVTFGIIT